MEVGHPDPARANTRSNGYIFERRVDYRSGQEGGTEKPRWRCVAADYRWYVVTGRR